MSFRPQMSHVGAVLSLLCALVGCPGEDRSANIVPDVSQGVSDVDDPPTDPTDPTDLDVDVDDRLDSSEDLAQEPPADVALDSTSNLDIDLENDPDEPTPLLISSPEVAESPNNLLSFSVYWTTSTSVPTVLTVRCDRGDYDVTFRDEVSKLVHEVFVMGLLLGATCQVDILATNGESTALEQLEFVVQDELPSLFPELTVVQERADEIQPGWTLVTPLNRPDNRPATLLLTDASGNVRWYYQHSRTGGCAMDAEVVEEGILVGDGCGVRAFLVDWRGEVVWTEIWNGNRRLQHDIRQTSPGTFLGLRTTTACDCGSTTYDAFVEFAWATNAVDWEWRLCDFFCPEPVYDDWDHLNTVVPFPGEEDWYLLSSRNLNSLIRVNRVTDEVAWLMGLAGRPEDGMRGDFAIDEADRFYSQHAPEFLPNGNIVVFDNGNDDRPYSRAIEIEYHFEPTSGGGSADVGPDVGDMGLDMVDAPDVDIDVVDATDASDAADATDVAEDPADTDFSDDADSDAPDSADVRSSWARVVWSYQPDPVIYTPSWGDADRLPNGNTLVTFGPSLAAAGTCHVTEVNSEGQVVWDLTLDPPWSSYRAERLDTNPHGFIIR